ncbi:MAG: Mannosyl-3-phosphoglycerate phosphatase [uncultured Sulfurovum sp.]|uniref:Mannosyl-3-phosphoglycerate phosphatase n=1 Tax=uncultured Sulfurovum sp. TaxID=269237 RepID=A0A6S6TGA9_9BACT|nr:MAG: Mannosyl-3-phosphoglycerate phosphatase [uncultured Sulfurovum sp.]
MKRIIFTDLDGTFLNHDDYSFKSSLQALKKIKQEQIPLIFTTSKTKSEVLRLQQEVGISEPFIVENGAALFIPQNYQGFNFSELSDFDDSKVKRFGKNYSEVLAFYTKYKASYGLIGLSDMTDNEISQLTGLDLNNVPFVKARDFTEPFILKDISKLETLQHTASKYDLKITKGGRFYHLMSKKQDKGVAVKETIRLFETFYKDKVHSIALGDSENDAPMLKNVDLPILIQKHDGSYLKTDILNIQKSSYQGSKGWNEMVLKHVE